LDSWDGVMDCDRRKSRSRICVNIGPHDRYFLFLNRSSNRLSRTIGSGGDDWNSDSEIGRDFLQSNPTYPIVAVRLEPGDAYVAATDMVFHDASTIGAPSRVFTLQIRLQLRQFDRAQLDPSLGCRSITDDSHNASP